MKVIKRFGSGLFSAWPLLLILKRKASGLMAVICLVGGRLFDHLYPSAPWAFHHLHLTNYSIRLKVGTHAHGRTGGQLLHPCHCSLLAAWPCPPRPPPPPRCLVPPPTLLHLCSPAPALSFLCPSRSGVATHDEWGVALVLCWPGFTATAHRPPSARPSVDLHYLPPTPPQPTICLLLVPCGSWWAFNHMLFHILFSYKFWKECIRLSLAIPQDESKTWLLYF